MTLRKSQAALSWPSEGLGGNDSGFTLSLLSAINDQNYCQVSMPSLDFNREEVVAEALGLARFNLPYLDVEEALLGKRSRSKVANIGQAVSECDAPDAMLGGCAKRMAELAYAIAPHAQNTMGFRIVPACQNWLCRVALERGERTALSPGPLTEQEVEQGVVEEYIKFLQGCKLCMIYCLDSDGGTLELSSKTAKSSRPVRLQATKDTLVIFRYDLMSYTYLQSDPARRKAGSTSSDVALQAWMLGEVQQYQMAGLDGDHQGLEVVYGGPKQAHAEQVHIFAPAVHIGGRGEGMDKHWLVFESQTDTFIQIPACRFDIDQYWAEDITVLGQGPKTYVKHSGLLADDEFQAFDPMYFGMDEKEASVYPPNYRLNLEICAASFHQYGHDRQSLRGKKWAYYVADSGSEADPFYGFFEDPENWVKGRGYMKPSASVMANYFGLCGPTMCIDTACSSSLVGSNLLHSFLKGGQDPEVKTGMISGSQICMAVAAYTGLAAAGMLGRMGRSMTFDMSANGYARGDAQAACIFKVAESSTEVRDRSGVFVGGFVNQDGRSASLTAPNGPSQKLCAEMSHRLNHILATEVKTQENHGTGTALGDPIEVGSMISVYKKGRGERPITITGGKSNQGHSEGCAGLSGILKSLNTLLHSTTPPQVHLNILNHHIDEVGFPGLFSTENIPQSLDVQGAIAGLNSFGFGGTNSHGELWARPRVAAEDSLTEQKRSSKQQKLTAIVAECPSCGGAMCYTCGMAMPVEPSSTRIHRCADIREQINSYEICGLCYKGGYYYRGADSLYAIAG
eukprot:TRINITY_DN22429_c0_g1_i1.p1 TRINITY_DN22429_c0_g1~~TRINITY_DN22429_c0_g1_i1.p1  ORF type:complete len:795 (-),score=121.18 TRINITY_DN22429_c0_g1_i1:40-2424(-)